ncbi:hypothetical protein OG558_15420 [Kribbella sp. NBC_01510]|uniref:hypothetical protein n=1 Tax=Kribbella sp. NBC_01510 TaxID=2903581 RepID=UPI00386FED9D
MTLIVAALVAGAATGGKDVVSTSIMDAYSSLKALLIKRFRTFAADQSNSAGQAPVEPMTVLEAHEANPDTWKAPLEEAVKRTGADQDPRILAAARALLAHADPQGAAAGKYQVDLRGAQGVQVGDHGQMNVSFGETTARRLSGSEPVD